MAESTRSGHSCWPDCANLYWEGEGEEKGGGFHWFIWKLFNLNMQHSHVSHFESHHRSPPCCPVILPSAEKALIFFTCNTKITLIRDGFSMKTTAVRQPRHRCDTWSWFPPGGQDAAHHTDWPWKHHTFASTSLRAGQAPGQLVLLQGLPLGNGPSVLQAEHSRNGKHTPSRSPFT